MTKDELSRRKLLKVGGLVAVVGPSIVLGDNTTFKAPKTDILLDEDYVEAAERVANCINVSDVHCNYRDNGNCSGCKVKDIYALFEPVNLVA